ncbi:hypothetical protein [Salmonella phage PhiSTP2]|nr:hypothetical protein [Salmonella phage PhiSTP2]
MSEWIKCSDLMPPVGAPVLVVGCVGNTVQKNVYEWDGETWSDFRNDYGEHPQHVFTHWMPLPEPPTE